MPKASKKSRCLPCSQQGEFDEARPETVELLSQMVNESRFVVIPDAGHFTLNDNRPAVVSAIQEFIDDQEN